jgi:tetratricopeptide (TPR) repeat protein
MDTRAFYAALDEAYSSGIDGSVEQFLCEQLALCANENCGQNLWFVMCMSELGSYYRNVGRYDASIQAFQKADRVLLLLLGEKSPERATNLNNMAGAYRMKGDLQSALNLFTQSISIYDSLPRRDPFLYAGVLNNTAVLYQHLGKTEEAIEYQTRSIEFLEKIPEARAELATALANLSSLRLEAYRKKKAKAPKDFLELYKLLDRAVEILRSQPDERSRYAAVLNSKAELLVEEGRHNEARKLLEETLPNFYSKNADYAAACLNLARLCVQTGALADAGRYYESSLAVLKNIFGDEHTKTREIQDEYRQINGNG